MTISATFNQGNFIALEIDRGSAPSGGQLVGAGSMWWTGGRRIPIVTEELPDFQDQQGTVFPVGHAGHRAINQQEPVVGRQWSEGGFNGAVVPDMFAALMYGALGGISSNMVPSGAPSLLVAEPINTDSKALVLAVQPSSGGNYLRMEVLSTGGVPSAVTGAVTVCGIDSMGNGASETLSVRTAGLYYFRTAFSAIGASSIRASGLSGASLTFYGVRHYIHTFTTASSAPTFTFERRGNPTAGNATSVANTHVGATVAELNLTNNGVEPDGILMAEAQFQGDPTVSCVASSKISSSPLKIMPAWTLRITRDGGTQYNRAKEFNLNIATGNRNTFTTAGSQAPGGTLIGPLEVTGNMTFHLEDEFEYNRWRGASKMTVYARWYSPWVMQATGTPQNMEIGASIPLYFETFEIEDDDGAFGVSADFRAIHSDDYLGPLQVQLISGFPGKPLNSIPTL